MSTKYKKVFPIKSGANTGYDDEGMFLLDYFAGKAMQAIITAPKSTISGGNGISDEKRLVIASYLIAEQMLIEREKHL